MVLGYVGSSSHWARPSLPAVDRFTMLLSMEFTKRDKEGGVGGRQVMILLCEMYENLKGKNHLTDTTISRLGEAQKIVLAQGRQRIQKEKKKEKVTNTREF